MTVPNMALSIREILERFSRGQSAPVNRSQPQYFEGEVPDFERMDKVEMAAYAKNLGQDIDDLKSLKRQLEQEERSKALNAISKPEGRADRLLDEEDQDKGKTKKSASPEQRD